MTLDVAYQPLPGLPDPDDVNTTAVIVLESIEPILGDDALFLAEGTTIIYTADIMSEGCALGNRCDILAPVETLLYEIEFIPGADTDTVRVRVAENHFDYDMLRSTANEAMTRIWPGGPSERSLDKFGFGHFGSRAAANDVITVTAPVFYGCIAPDTGVTDCSVSAAQSDGFFLVPAPTVVGRWQRGATNFRQVGATLIENLFIESTQTIDPRLLNAPVSQRLFAARTLATTPESDLIQSALVVLDVADDNSLTNLVAYPVESFTLAEFVDRQPRFIASGPFLFLSTDEGLATFVLR